MTGPEDEEDEDDEGEEVGGLVCGTALGEGIGLGLSKAALIC